MTPGHEDPNPLIGLFRRCVVCVTDEQGRFLGSGFFVAPGQVVTCGHVIHRAAGLQVRWQERVAAVSAAAARPPLASVADPGSYPLPDLAVLGTEEAAGWGHPCAALTVQQPVLGGTRDGLYLAGYTVEHGPIPALTGVTTEFESLVTEDGHTFYKLKRGQLLPGFSGSPLLDLRTGLVAGITESSRGRHADLGGFAVPVAELAGAFPELLGASRAFHDRDERWKAAAQAEKVRAEERNGGRARLPLRPPVVALAPDEDLSPAKVLRPRHAAVEYVGREQLLGELAAWCEDEPAGGGSLGVWFVTGGGGFGKTRLAVEACREAEARGWTAGLLRPDVSQDELGALAEWPGRLLIAVDYAATRPGLAGQLAEELAARAPRPSARIMLLVRRRASRADLLEWFNEQREEQLDALLRQSRISRLEDDSSEVDRLELFQRAVSDFVPFLGPAPAAVRPPRLRAAHFARPLYVLAAAYLARASSGVDVDALSEAGLLRTLLAQHEAGHWARWDKRRGLGLDAIDRRAAVAVATLLTAVGEDEALTVARLVPHLGDEPESRLIAVARWLVQLYRPPGEGSQLVISPLEPDRLGEVLVGDVLREHPGLLAAALDVASDRQLARALIVTGRAAREDQAVNAQLRDALDERLPDIFERGLGADNSDLLNAVITAMTTSRPARGALDTAERFPDALPGVLRPLAVIVTALAVDGLRAQASDTPAALADLAMSLNILGNRLSDVGQRQEALEAVREAVTHYRQLAVASPAAYLPDLASSLNNLSVSLGEVGQRQEALKTAREVVAIRQQLAEDNPAYLPDLAASLNNLANRLSGVGQWQEALKTAREAVTHSRQLAEDNPAAYLPGLAASLNNLTVILGEVGQRQEALKTAREAVTHYRQLAEDNLAAYLPGLAMSLNTLALRLSDFGHGQEALEAVREAVTHYWQLAEASPAAYLPGLAASLNNLATVLSGVGQWQEALDAAREAVTPYRQLAEDNPAAYLPGLAASLNTLATVLSMVGQWREALDAAREAVAHYRQLAEASPTAYLPDLAGSLNNLAAFLDGVGQQQEALDTAREAVAHYRQLAEATPAAYLPDLAMSLNNLASRLSEVGQQQEALDAAREAVTHHRLLAEATPAAYLPNLAGSLNNLATVLSSAGQAEQAEKLFAETLSAFAGSSSGIGHVLLARGRWRAGQDRLADAIPDLTAAVRAFDGDAPGRGQARQALRALRENDGPAFDHAWEPTHEPLPGWLQYPATDQQLTGKILAWIGAGDSQASRAYLDGNIAALLTDEAEAALEHLTDINPADGTLLEHLTLLQAARTHGADTAYASRQEQLLTRQLGQVLKRWVRTPTWDASRAFAVTHSGELLHPAIQAILNDWSDRGPADPALRLHRGLLGYAVTAGFDAAYDLLPDTARLQAMIADPATPAGTRLALARLYSGQADDDPEAHFQLAAATLLTIAHQAELETPTSLTREATAAIADCADNAAPYEQRDFARRLSKLGTEYPRLALITTELRHILTSNPDIPPTGD